MAIFRALAAMASRGQPLGYPNDRQHGRKLRRLRLADHAHAFNRIGRVRRSAQPLSACLGGASMGHPDLLESVGIGTSVFSHCGYLTGQSWQKR